MHRRPVGRSRMLAAAGAVVILVGCVLPWWTVGGGDSGLPARTGNAFDSFGIIVFAAAIATLAVVTLPYASERPVAADRWLTYALFAGAGWVAFALRIYDLASVRAFRIIEPADVVTRYSGLWVSAIGLVILARAAYDMLSEPRLR